MDTSKSNNKNTVTLTLTGLLDVRSSAKLEAELMSLFTETDKNITLDFKGVTYVSSSGLRVLLTGEKTAKKEGRTMTIINVSSFVMQIFDVTGFSNNLTFG